MSRRKWYKKKRIWGLIFLAFLFLITKMEWAKIRYDRQAFLKDIAANSTATTSYDTKQIAGKTIHFLKKINQKDFPLLVMVHGSPGALNAYETYLEDPMLNAQMNLISVDRSGFGYSDFGTSESSLKVQAALIAEILKDYPHQKKILVGHSMGGPVISKLAMDFPNLVDGMVMVAPSISPALEPSNAWRKAINFPLIRWFTPTGLNVCNQEIIPLRKELEKMLSGWKEIKIPISIVQGEEDFLVPKENAFFAKSMMPDNLDLKTVLIKGGNHFILWSEIPLIIGEILGVLEKVEGR